MLESYVYRLVNGRFNTGVAPSGAVTWDWLKERYYEIFNLELLNKQINSDKPAPTCHHPDNPQSPQSHCSGTVSSSWHTGCLSQTETGEEWRQGQLRCCQGEGLEMAEKRYSSFGREAFKFNLYFISFWWTKNITHIDNVETTVITAHQNQVKILLFYYLYIRLGQGYKTQLFCACNFHIFMMQFWSV